MATYKRINLITGWIVCIFASIVYILTREATGSFWDCGEFISCAYKLQIPHPPGAPLFILLGRLFIILFSGSLNAVHPSTTAALDVNLLSALASGFTILFLFWTITYFAKRLLINQQEQPSAAQTIAIMGAGVVGALAYTFSDSFWFSAVEGEVYALSSLFTALVFWTMIKWDEAAARQDPDADRWIVLTFYLMGLSIGVHLLCLLVIPAVVMIYYLQRYPISRRGVGWAFVIGCLLTGFVQTFVIRYSVKLAALFDIFFVNSLHLPFNSGSYFFIILLAACIAAGIIWTKRKQKYLLHLGLWCFAFLMFGYATYFTTLIRSNANPAIDMYNVDNPISLLGYLDREQYGDWPILYGPYFTAQPTGIKETGNIYEKGKDRYEIVGKKVKYTYASSDMHLFPRVWDNNNSQHHVDFYRDWLGLAPNEQPGFMDNIKWFLGYQMGWMYMRYFLWNFSGRQNDIQGLGNPRDGNWITGISFIDNWRLGDQSKMPDSLKHNQAHNRLFALPLILGLIGLFFQLNRRLTDFMVVLLLFFFTGLAIVIYLNQAGPQPRERDYAYVGSFYAFAIWIGLGVLWVYEKLLAVWKQKAHLSAVTASVICLLAVPVLMGFQEWDDHDRSQKTLPRDVAKDYLESCAPHAILFTSGDNDTYPLWYAQEVEGIRTDVRVVNLSLLGVDWYINELRYKVNDAEAVPMIWQPEQYFGDRRNYIRYFELTQMPKNQYFNLEEVLHFMGSDDPKDQLQDQYTGERINFLPTKNLYVPVDKATVLRNGTVPFSDSARIVSALQFTLQTNILFKNDLMVLNIIAANHWNRPIYFTSPLPGNQLGLNQYLHNEGMVYRLVPVEKPAAAAMSETDTLYASSMYATMLHRFGFGGADRPGTYFDETNRGMLLNIRNAFAKEVQALAIEGKKDSALQLLHYLNKHMLPQDVPYGYTSSGNLHNISSLQLTYASYLAGDSLLAHTISKDVIHDCQQQIQYYQALGSLLTNDLADDKQRADMIIQQLQLWEKSFRSDSLEHPLMEEDEE
ncbi:glycosyltransferase family 117 protein [Thermoflavifilum thermophilum]|uniref:DUF2723 domain-containing protein n=1 Tax=Thermoflavifilum thermophilum TaxID=1393122 RepID=A0A1I7MX95_9BACT|nr:DUF2723 domain-containing protein [Thermoflavifilum thermophilum]SFV26985.1 Protein of unknown function [Thermoflavifilum thermophilum]